MKMINNPIFSEMAIPNEQLNEAIKSTMNGSKHILVHFGGNWNSWCNKLFS